MKRLIIFALVALTSVWAIAQDNSDEIKTLFGNSEKQTIGGYGGISTSYGQVNGMDAIFIGGRGAVIINHSLALGLGGKGFISETTMDNNLNDEFEFTGGYGGIVIEPIIGAKMPIHMSFPVLIGAGGIGYMKHWGEYDSDYEDYENYNEDSDAFFVVEPGVEIEFNLVKFMRIAATVSYRLTSNVNLKYKDWSFQSPSYAGTNIAPKDMMNGLNFGIIMKFGKF